jgi:hypothetical protein
MALRRVTALSFHGCQGVALRATKRSINGPSLQRASLLLGLLVAIATPSFAQHTTLYGAPQYQQSTNWWSSLTGGSVGGATNPAKIPAAGRPVSKTPHPAVARIIVPERKSAALGSGTLIGKTAQHGYLITNWHVVREAKDGALVVFANGTQAQGRIIRTDKDWDLAVIQIPAPAIEPLSISSVVPKVGEQLWIAGYGSGEFLLQAGLCSQYLAPYPEWPMELVEVGAAARQGDSGGPIMNANGELAGVLFGQGEGYTMGAFGGRVLQFLNQVPDLDSPIRGSLAQLAAVRAPSVNSAPAIAATPEKTWGQNRIHATLVSNSPERNSEQRYWVPERRQPTPPTEIIPQPPVPNPTTVAAQASPRSNAAFALNASSPVPAAAPQSIYSMPQAPPIAPAVTSQYQPTPEASSKNALAKSPSGYGMRSTVTAEQPPVYNVSLAGTPSATAQHLSFEDLAGHTLMDQVITGLWCLGGIYLLFKICGWLTKSGSATPAKKSRTVVRKPVLKAVAPRVQKNDLYSYDDEDEDEDDDDDEDEDEDEDE